MQFVILSFVLLMSIPYIFFGVGIKGVIGYAILAIVASVTAVLLYTFNVYEKGEVFAGRERVFSSGTFLPMVIYKADTINSPLKPYGYYKYDYSLFNVNGKPNDLDELNLKECDKAYCIALSNFDNAEKIIDTTLDKTKILTGINRCNKEFGVAVNAKVQVTSDVEKYLTGKSFPALLEASKTMPPIIVKNTYQGDRPTNIHFVNNDELTKYLFAEQNKYINEWFDRLNQNPNTMNIIEQGIVEVNTTPYKKPFDAIKATFKPPRVEFSALELMDFDSKGDPIDTGFVLSKSPVLSNAFSCIN